MLMINASNRHGKFTRQTLYTSIRVLYKLTAHWLELY